MNSAGIAFPNLSPEIFSIDIGGFELALRWYALAYIAGILIGWWICARALKHAALWPCDQPPMTPKMLEGFVTWLILGIILGGRLGFVLFYQPGYYLANPLDILKIWQGGMSFHGGFLGVAIAATIFCVRNRIPLLTSADMLAMVAPIGLFFGRIANFINAELWERPTDMPWGVIFPGAAAQDCAGMVGACARHPSQLYEAGLEGALLGAILLTAGLRFGGLKRPGLLTGLFLVGYGLARPFVELFRQPDAQFGSPENPVGYIVQFDTWGLTMGQLLSLPMLLVGLALIAAALISTRRAQVKTVY